ncbi:unnamed protein product [Notodromas monacha]|uniref:Uncharacterized protein n=1 Tax=Notodromas monacha TaxID=399045 RepID=A0A7R9BPD3_9CRUS|nr:unnamed protein product [Notodromas monacha]CAG0918346.1 unnamed protein product [Notodromas monacha]
MRGSIQAYLQLLSTSGAHSGTTGRQVGVVEVASDVVVTKRPREVTASVERWLSHYPSDRNEFCLECGLRKAVENLWTSMRGSIQAYLQLLSTSGAHSGTTGRQVGVVEVASDVVVTKRPREVTASVERWLSHYPSDRNEFCLECGLRKAVEKVKEKKKHVPLLDNFETRLKRVRVVSLVAECPPAKVPLLSSLALFMTGLSGR